MQAVQVEQIRIPIPHTAGRQTGAPLWKEPTNNEGEKRDIIPPFRHSGKDGSKHHVCVNQQDCPVVDNELSTTKRNGSKLCKT